MRRERLPLELARAVDPVVFRELLGHLGWQPVQSRRADVVAIYHSPDAPAYQVVVPIDLGLSDYAESVAEAINRLATHQQRPAHELLDELLLPPADLLQFDLSGAPSAGVALPLDYALNLLAEARKALLAVAHSVLDPRPEHPRLDRQPAVRLVAACLVVRPNRSHLAQVLACPLEAVPTEGSLLEGQSPLARRVTTGLMRTLRALADAALQQRGDDLLRTGAPPLLSANLCEAIAALCPPDWQQSLTVSACWSHHLPANGAPLPDQVRLDDAVFALAEYLAPRLRTSPRLQPTWHVGFVQELRGRPGPDDRSSGEVQVSITQVDEVVPARLELAADEYALASTAHLTNAPVYFRGVLYRSAGLHRVEQVGPFLLVQRPTLAHAS